MTHSSLCIHVGLAGLLFCLAITTSPSLSAGAESREPATTVYYLSTRGSDHWSGRLPAPAVDRQDGPFATLIELRGTPDAPLKHITISGLTFSHTLSPFPDHLHDNFHSPTLRGAGITLEHCRGCRIEKNRFVMLGGDGVRLQGSNARNEVAGNEISHVGGAGIVLVSQRQVRPRNGDSTRFYPREGQASHLASA